MNTDSILFWYFIFGLITTLINGAIRKIEADALLGFVWFLCWWMTPITLILRGLYFLYLKISEYEICEKTKKFILSKF